MKSRLSFVDLRRFTYVLKYKPILHHVAIDDIREHQAARWRTQYADHLSVLYRYSQHLRKARCYITGTDRLNCYCGIPAHGQSIRQ